MSRIDEARLKTYDIVGLSSLTNSIPEAYRMADSLRRSGVTVVMGGPHVSFMPEEALSHCDYVASREGDVSFLSLVSAIAQGEPTDSIPGISSGKNGDFHTVGQAAPVDYPSLPSPDFSLSPQVDKKRVPPIIVTSRGCPHDCIFCTVSAMFGRKYRFKSNEQVIEELKPVLNRSVCFGDDNFCANPGRTTSLLKALIDRKSVPLRWSGEMCVEAGGDEELLDLMKETRCRIIFVGIESLNQETLKLFRKVHKVAATEKCIDNLHRRNIGIHGMFVAGPEDTPDSVREIVDYAIKTDIDTIQILSLTPMPGTVAYRELEPRLLHHKWEHFDGQHVVVEPRNCSAYDLQLAIIKQMERFYSLKRLITGYRPGRAWRLKYRGGGAFIVRRWLRENREYLEQLRTNFYRSSSPLSPAL